MDIFTIVRVVAVVCIGLLAGIFLGDRAGSFYVGSQLSPSGFVQFQQIVHSHYVRFMPALVLTALFTSLVWLFMVRLQWRSLQFWLIATSFCGIALIAGLTRAVNVPLNNLLMTWNVASPPVSFREIWAPWERVNTIRAVVAPIVLLLEALALSLTLSIRR